MLDFGILGMNARNLQYIKKFNPAKAIRLADNKFNTKRFLGDRGIPVPATYDIIKTREQLYQYDFSALPQHDFIIKPVRGSRGRGIYRIKLVSPPKHVGYLEKFGMFDRLFTTHSPYIDQRYHISGDYVDDTTMRRYLVDILDGKHSLTMRRDTIMLEEVLLPGSGFEAYCEHGLADIRVIVFNLIPVAAMLRVPTPLSDGKANLDRGALGMGVEVGSGKIYAMYQNKKIYTKNFPAPYSHFSHQHLPYWDDILSYSSKIQYFANLGYLALDWVITDEGPKLLEINARAGLKFQNASLLPLRKRLNRIKDVRINSPEKGVEIAQTLFSSSKGQVITSSKVLYLRQDGALTIQYKDKKHIHDIVVEVDTSKKRSYMSPGLYAKIQRDGVKHTLKIGTKGITFVQAKWKELTGGAKNKVVLGKDLIKNYYIKPIEKALLVTDFIHPSKLLRNEVDQLHLLDTALAKLSRILNFSRILKPTNLLDQLDNFITRGGNYNPTFTYRWPSDTKLQEVQDEITYIQDNYFGTNSLQSTFAFLFKEKLGELSTKLALLRAYKTQKYEAIAHGNRVLFGDVDGDLLSLAKEKLFIKQSREQLLGAALTGWELRKRIMQYLHEQGLSQVKVQFDQDSVARMTVGKIGKHITLKISPKAIFREDELRATLAHEIDVHIQRYIHGLHTGRQLMKTGTAGYITDEEGLAVHMSQQYLPDGYERLGSYMRYFFVKQAEEKDFAGLASMIRGLRGVSLVSAFNDTLRIKKGMIDTTIKHAGSVYMKDKIYLDGRKRVGDWIDQGGDPQQLMIGKVKINDLPYII